MRFLHRRSTEEDEDFVEFVGEVSSRLLRTAYLLCGSKEDAKDLVQEALERACRKWHRIAATDSPEAYVRRIMLNLANARWRRISRLRESEQALAAQRADPGDEYGRLELRDQLITLLEDLPIRMRTIIVLRYFHDMDDARIAGVLGIAPSSVRSQLSRGLAKLRTAVEEAAAADPDSADAFFADGVRTAAEASVSDLLPAARFPLGGVQ
jgi:RNA polymerase sigma-70 factor (sigma-E family)